MDYGYNDLITEVSETNDLLVETNELLTDISEDTSIIVIFLFALAALKGADMVHHLVDACFKRRK